MGHLAAHTDTDDSFQCGCFLNVLHLFPRPIYIGHGIIKAYRSRNIIRV